LVPVMVILEPPARRPEAGVMEEMVGVVGVVVAWGVADAGLEGSAVGIKLFAAEGDRSI